MQAAIIATHFTGDADEQLGGDGEVEPDGDNVTATFAGVIAAAFQLETDSCLLQCVDDDSDEVEEFDAAFLATRADPCGSSLSYSGGDINYCMPSSSSPSASDDDDDDDDDDDEDEDEDDDEDNEMVDGRRLADLLIPLIHSKRRIVRRQRIRPTATSLIHPSGLTQHQSNVTSSKVVATTATMTTTTRTMTLPRNSRKRPMSKRQQAELRRRIKRKAPPVFAEITVPLFSDSQFRSCFRISRRACEALIRRLVPQILEGMVCRDNPVKSGRPPIPLDKKVLIVLWFFANPQSFRAISERFEVAKSSVEDSFRRVITALVEIAGDYVRWPTGNYAREVIEQFRELSGLPGILGALGTARFTIKTNKETPKTYADAKGHSIYVQFVCDHQMLITDCFGVLPGSVSDVAAFRRSDLHARILTAPGYTTLFPDDSYLIGGETLPVEPWLITPYADASPHDSCLPPAKQYFNRCALLALGVMHRTVALLKGRFARLRLLEMSRLDYLPLCVSAACVLHNACLIEDDREVDYVQEFVDAGWESTMATMGLGRAPLSTALGAAGGGDDDDGSGDPDQWLLGCQKRNLLCNTLLLPTELTDANSSVDG